VAEKNQLDLVSNRMIRAHAKSIKIRKVSHQY